MKSLIRCGAATVVAIVFTAGAAVAQDVPKARDLMRQAMAALEPPPTPAAIATPADLMAAIAAAAPGDVLTLSRSLVYPDALIVSKSVTLQAEGLTALTRMDTMTPLPVFQDG